MTRDVPKKTPVFLGAPYSSDITQSEGGHEFVIIPVIRNSRERGQVEREDTSLFSGILGCPILLRLLVIQRLFPQPQA